MCPGLSVNRGVTRCSRPYSSPLLRNTRGYELSGLVSFLPKDERMPLAAVPPTGVGHLLCDYGPHPSHKLVFHGVSHHGEFRRACAASLTVKAC